MAAVNRIGLATLLALIVGLTYKGRHCCPKSSRLVSNISKTRLWPSPFRLKVCQAGYASVFGSRVNLAPGQVEMWRRSDCLAMGHRCVNLIPRTGVTTTVVVYRSSLAWNVGSTVSVSMFSLVPYAPNPWISGPHVRAGCGLQAGYGLMDESNVFSLKRCETLRDFPGITACRRAIWNGVRDSNRTLPGLDDPISTPLLPCSLATLESFRHRPLSYCMVGRSSSPSCALNAGRCERVVYRAGQGLA
jgi:hypothetical protein